MSASALRLAYLCLVALVAGERGFEVALSLRNRRRALARGGLEFGGDHYPWMVLLHAVFLGACAAEVWFLRRPWIPGLGFSMLPLLAGSMSLRYWAIATLGERWNTRVVVLPGAPAVTGGPYRFLRHPNYLAVGIEMLALPLLHTAWITALLGSALNAWVLRVRIRVEEEALRRYCDYDARLAGRRRLVPGPSS